VFRAHFGLYFFGQVGTFTYLLNAMAGAAQFNVEQWPQFSVYNLVVANFWPVYWLVYFVDSAKLDETYWRVYEVALARAADFAGAWQYVAG
jgi:hypothetical protein